LHMDQEKRGRFEELALPHLDTVHNIARAMTHNGIDAEDMVQETFVRAWQSFDGFQTRGYGAKPWLLKILQNVFYSSFRRSHRQPTLIDSLAFDGFEEEMSDPDTEPVTSETLNWDTIDDELRDAFDRLAPEFRTVLLLWAIEGLSYKEIAVACDCALGTVMSRLYRARRILGRDLRAYARQRNLSTERFDP